MLTYAYEGGGGGRTVDLRGLDAGSVVLLKACRQTTRTKNKDSRANPSASYAPARSPESFMGIFYGMHISP